MAKTINFFKNHNGKLKCQFFMTVRPEWPEYYKKGEHYAIILNKVFQFDAELIEIKPFYLKDINQFISLLDAAKTPEEFKAEMKRMYPKKDFRTEKMYILLLKNTQW